MSKLVISQEQAIEIEKRKHINMLENSVIHHIDGKWTGEKNHVLNDLTLDEFIRALFIGYEIEREYKIGDWVTHVKDHVSKITKIKEEGNHVFTDCKLTGYALHEERYLNTDKVHFRHATSEEIAEEKQRRFWNESGRKVGEFKKNDILSVEGANYAYTISKVLVGKGDNKLYKIDEDSARYTKEMLLKGFVVACFAHDRKDIKND